MLAGVYLLILVLAPVPEPPVAATSASWNKPIHTPQPLEDRVYIPRLNLNLAYKSGDKTVLNDALWHRFPDRGNPETGGNYILAGHRFVIGLTPGETIRRSPLYHVGSMRAGDYIYADYHGRRYQYQVTRIYSVKPTATNIEDRSSTDKLTLYTCTLGGEKDGRTVVEGKLVGRQIDPDGILKVSISG
jgi:sortase A